jgi:hypothetical protein
MDPEGRQLVWVGSWCLRRPAMEQQPQQKRRRRARKRPGQRADRGGAPRSSVGEC